MRVPNWSKGRITLIGDAASCLSLFGDGSSTAMVGAFTLAQELAFSPKDHQAAFRRYESKQRKLVEPKERIVKVAGWLLIPATRFGILTRNRATRLIPTLTAVQSVRRHHAAKVPPSSERAASRNE